MHICADGNGVLMYVCTTVSIANYVHACCFCVPCSEIQAMHRDHYCRHKPVIHQRSLATIVSNHKLEMGMLNGLEMKQHFHVVILPGGGGKVAEGEVGQGTGGHVTGGAVVGDVITAGVVGQGVHVTEGVV